MSRSLPGRVGVCILGRQSKGSKIHEHTFCGKTCTIEGCWGRVPGQQMTRKSRQGPEHDGP